MSYQSKIILHKKLPDAEIMKQCDTIVSENLFPHGHFISLKKNESTKDSESVIKPINVAVQKCTYLPMYIQDPALDGQTPTAMSSQS